MIVILLYIIVGRTLYLYRILPIEESYEEQRDAWKVERIFHIIWLEHCTVFERNSLCEQRWFTQEFCVYARNENVSDLPDTWKKPFLFWWFLLGLSTTDLQTSTCGCRCVALGTWCDANVGRWGPYICASLSIYDDGPRVPANTPTQRPSAQGRCLLSCCCCWS